MLKVRHWAAVATVFLIICACAPAKESLPKTSQGDKTKISDSLRYLPVSGDRAVMFTHRFKAEDYEAGKRTVIGEFSKAMQASGQTRRTYFLGDADSHVVVAISFFHANSSVDEWISSTERQKVLEVLGPLYREGLEIQHITVEKVHDTPIEASYLPRNGDRVIIFTLRFTADGYRKGKRTVVEGFGKAMETSGQTRRTYFTDDPQSHTMVTFSFFRSDSYTDEWLRHPQRHKVLAVLEPLFREPLEVYSLKVEEVHDTK